MEEDPCHPVSGEQAAPRKQCPILQRTCLGQVMAPLVVDLDDEPIAQEGIQDWWCKSVIFPNSVC